MDTGRDRKKSWQRAVRIALIISVGLTMGVTLGLALAWQWVPLPFITVSPADMAVEHKEEYLRLVAETFAEDGDLGAAQARLERLHAGNAGQWVAELAVRASEQNDPTGRDLAHLAEALGISGEGLPGGLPAPAETVTPAVPVTPTPAIHYRVLSQRSLSCRELPGPARIQVYVRDEAGAGLTGIPLRIAGNGHQETFFTGLKGADPGYADYDVQDKGTYTLVVDVPGSEAVSGLRGDELTMVCPARGQNLSHGWEIVFQREGMTAE